MRKLDLTKKLTVLVTFVCLLHNICCHLIFEKTDKRNWPYRDSGDVMKILLYKSFFKALSDEPMLNHLHQLHLHWSQMWATGPLCSPSCPSGLETSREPSPALVTLAPSCPQCNFVAIFGSGIWMQHRRTFQSPFSLLDLVLVIWNLRTFAEGMLTWYTGHTTPLARLGAGRVYRGGKY